MKVLELIEVLSELEPGADVIVAIGEDSRYNIVYGTISDADQIEAGTLNDEKIDVDHDVMDPIVVLRTEE